MSDSLPHYAAKPTPYFEDGREEMLPYVPGDCRRILDVGCSAGVFGAHLKRTRNVEVWGLEPFRAAAEAAATRLDRVICGVFGENPDLQPHSFDCLIFNDVIEHIEDSDAVLARARALLTEQGYVVASIPNIRHFPTLWHLAVHGKWEYREWGTLDRTHLRFFTRSSIAALFEKAGFSILTLEGIRPFEGVPNASRRVWRLYTLVDALTFGRFRDMRYERFVIVARLPGPLA